MFRTVSVATTVLVFAAAASADSFPITFDEVTPPAVTPFGGASYAIEVGPAGGDGNALKIVRDGGEDWAGVYVTVSGVPNDAGPQTISAMVYSPTGGIPIITKLEFGDNTGTGEVQANETVVEGLQTLSWTFTNLASPNDYRRFVIVPNFGTVDSAQNYYFDNIDLVVAAFSADGAVESKSGGFKFPDGTVQMTAMIAGPSVPTMPTYVIGDTGPAGGIVFYVTDGGLHGLEAAPVDQGVAEWGCIGADITGADGTAIGTGAQNTMDILLGCHEFHAARVADSYVLNGFSDWFLPSMDELNLMYQNLHVASLGGFANVIYWISSDDSDSGAWGQYFGDGSQGVSFKSDPDRVRAVRAF